GVFWAAGPNCVGNVSCGSPLGSAPPDAGAPNATAPTGGTDDTGGGFPFALVGAGLLVAAVGGTAVAVRTMGRNAVIDRVEAAGALVVAVVALVVDAVPTDALPSAVTDALPVSTGGGGADAHRIVLANVDSSPVACRVRCRTGDGVEFEYDLRLDPDERREARELPGSRPFELTVQVDGGSVQQTFEEPTDVGVRVATQGAELTT
ncbi:MAG: hypothetical protein ABEI75_03705, partial [Halobaculum sp.]